MLTLYTFEGMVRRGFSLKAIGIYLDAVEGEGCYLLYISLKNNYPTEPKVRQGYRETPVRQSVGQRGRPSVHRAESLTACNSATEADFGEGVLAVKGVSHSTAHPSRYNL